MSELDDDEQEVKKSKGKKIHSLRDHNSDDEETDTQGPRNKGTDKDNDDDDKMRPMTSKHERERVG